MALDLRGIFFNLFKPAAPTGYINLPIQSDGGAPYECISVAAPLATTTTAGLAKPDGTSITVATDGTIAAVVTPSAVQQEAYTYAADTGAANAYAVALTPAPSIVAGSVVSFKAAHANTGASTLAVNGGTATAITKNGTTALASGDIAAGQLITARFDGTQWQILTGAGASTPIATATTVGTVKPGTGLSVATDGTLNLSLSAPHFVSNTASANSNTGANLVATFGANVTAGSAILVILAPGPGHNPGATITSITDNHGNSYSLVMNVPGAGPDGFGTYYGSQLIYAAYNVAAGATTITVVYSQLNGQLSLLALEYAGVVSASPVDGTPASTASTGTSLTAGPVTTANANDLLISSCAFATVYSPLTNTPPAGYTQEASVALGGREIWVADQAVSATGSYSATWTNNDTGLVASKTVALFALKSAGASSAFVTSYNGRAGIVTSQPGDYSDAQISFSDVTTNNVSTSAHGYAPKLPGDATKYLDGSGAFSVPPTATGTNASQIQGVNVSATAPTTNQVLTYNGTQWVPAAGGGGGSGALILLEQHTASSSASLNFASWYNSAYDTYLVKIVNLVLGTNTAGLVLRFSTNGGSSYDSSAIYDFSNVFTLASASGGYDGAQNQTSLRIGIGQFATALSYGTGGEFSLDNPASTTTYKNIYGKFYGKDARDGATVLQQGSYVGAYRSTSAVNAFQVFATSGNIVSGSVRIYGLAH